MKNFSKLSAGLFLVALSITPAMAQQQNTQMGKQNGDAAALPNNGRQPIGVPFTYGGQNISSVPLPASNQQMTLNPTHVDASIKKAVQQADTRINDLTNADTSAYKGEIDEMSAIQRQIRILDLKKIEADKAIALWKTVYDGKTESDLAAQHTMPPTTAVPSIVGNPPPQAFIPHQQQQQSEPDPDPKVSSIMGSNGDLTATILVPYMGEVKAKNKTLLPNGMRVKEVTTSGVVVTKNGKTTVLSLGDSVPAYRTQQAQSPKSAVQLPPGFNPKSFQ